MELGYIDFSEKKLQIDKIYDHVRYYYTKALIALDISQNNKKEAMELYKEIRDNLKVEYKEYEKTKNWKLIYENKLYLQYKDNIVNAYVKPTNVTAYRSLNGNLYDVYDYMQSGFLEYLRGKNKIDLDIIEEMIDKKCKVVTNDFLVFEGIITEINIDNGYLIIRDFEENNKLIIKNINTIDEKEQ